MRTDISIIMPLYNAERFLEETLISVSKQIFCSYELICVDDGSDDGTVDIVQKFQNNDSRIKLICNEKHLGAAEARNNGIKSANGKYLIFLDGDDIFDEELLSLTFQKAEESDAEIVMFEAVHVPSDQIYKKRQVTHSAKFYLKFCQQVLSVRGMKVCDFLIWPGNLGTKLFRRDLIDGEHLQFQNLSCENDTYFVMMAFFLARRVLWLDSGRVMLYARDHDTASRISSDRDPMCVYYAMRKVRDELEKRDIFDELSQLYYYRTFFFLFDGLRCTKTTEKKMEFYDFLTRDGFDSLFGCNGSRQGIDIYIQEKLQEFTQIRMGAGWEKLISFYDVFLEDNLQEIERLFYDAGRTKRVGVWGTGNNGSRFLTFCRRHFLPVTAVIDSDEAKHGNYCEGHCIQTPQVSRRTDTVISTPDMGYGEIKKVVNIYNTAAEVIDLNTYICRH